VGAVVGAALALLASLLAVTFGIAAVAAQNPGGVDAFPGCHGGVAGTSRSPVILR